jgi:hypothetical protein
LAAWRSGRLALMHLFYSEKVPLRLQTKFWDNLQISVTNVTN